MTETPERNVCVSGWDAGSVRHGVGSQWVAASCELGGRGWSEWASETTELEPRRWNVGKDPRAAGGAIQDIRHGNRLPRGDFFSMSRGLRYLCYSYANTHSKLIPLRYQFRLLPSFKLLDDFQPDVCRRSQPIQQPRNTAFDAPAFS